MTRALETRRFASFDGTELAYHEAGRGAPVVLLHGFAADTQRNWVEPGVTDALLDQGWRVVALDARGHGDSAKPHEPEAYAGGAMPKDVVALLDHLAIDAAAVCGYSMGALTALRLAGTEPRATPIVFGGIGANVLHRGVTRGAPGLADALLAEDPRSISNPVARAFRVFAGATGADRVALAAMQRARASEEDWAGDVRCDAPSLVVTGAADELVGDPGPLAERLGARLVVVPGNHLTAIFSPEFTSSVVGFLGEPRSS